MGLLIVRDKQEALDFTLGGGECYDGNLRDLQSHSGPALYLSCFWLFLFYLCKMEILISSFMNGYEIVHTTHHL